jgi:heat shock protein HtpX
MANARPALDLGTPVHGFTISTETTKGNLVNFPKFLTGGIEPGRFGTIAVSDFRQVAGEHGKFLLFKATNTADHYAATVRIKLDSPLQVDIFSSPLGNNPEFNKRLEDYLLLALQLFEEALRRETIYMGFVPGSKPTSRLAGRSGLWEKLFRGNMINIFLLFILLSTALLFFLLWIGLDWMAPIIMTATLLVVVLSAGKIMAITSDWRMNEEHSDVVIVEIQMDGAAIPWVLANKREALAAIKGQVYSIMSDWKRSLSSAEVAGMFQKAGIEVSPEQIIVKRINVYDIVKKAAQRFNMPTPAVVVTKNQLPNAAAMGFTRKLATMMITFGLLVQLEKREIELVVGHELSHLRFGDPAVLFSIITAEYLLRVYVLVPNLEFFSYGTFPLLYLLLIFWLIFFFAKFLEARADLESAYILKDPQTMATSLKKIGFRRLLLDARFIEGRHSTFGDWLAFDPHPPIGFRIRRLESLDMSKPPKHPFLRSVSDVFGGISRSSKKEGSGR